MCIRDRNRYELGLGDDDNLEWSTSDPVEGSCTKIELECPHCEQVIYSNEGDSEDPQFWKLLGVNPPFGG